MKCFYHNQQDAVGICKNCHKGLCSECAADFGNGLACKGRCETQVKELNEIVESSQKWNKQTEELINKSKTIYQRSERSRLGRVVVSFLIGSVFIGFGLYSGNNPFMIAIGTIFVMASCFEYLNGKNAARNR